MKNKMKEKMKTILLNPLGFLLLFLLATQITFAQVAINEDDTDANAKAALDVKSTTKGVLLPNLSQTERDNLVSPATGLIIYNRTVGYFNYYNGTKWCRIERTLVLDPAVNPTTTANDVGVGIGISDPDNSAILHVNANNKGVLIPRMASLVTAPPTGLILYNTSTNIINYYNGTDWVPLDMTIESDPNTSGTNVAEGVVIGATTVDATAKLEVKSTTLGVLFPRMTSAQRDLINSPAEGLLIYNTSMNQFQYFTDNKWYAFSTPSLYTNVQVFSYTGSNQTFTIPANKYFILVKMWGAGGAGGNSWTYNYAGGGGGYAWGKVAVVPGQTYTIIVGQQGRTSVTGTSFGGGGNRVSNYGGGGGGRSAIRTSTSVELITAGAGGGGGCMTGTNQNQYGGAGGGTSGLNANIVYSDVAGRGGSQVAGGVGQGGNGSQYTGGTSGNTNGASGGGGWYGGAGGLYGGTNNWCMGGGGGGSSYYGGANVFTGGTTPGSGTTPGNNGDSDYAAGIGNGGGAAANGGHGRVVIRW
ncbi:MAG: hypothetical protein UR28_C0024G0002 [Candidatus Peregrinibacteria bacterium GW2011_GWF2_33_10]|nr:MAG: hypothetical protein UR28_C0024G0002 [Candidatus Peregrinibacteria bacterium GW2011_GWF2_33_10]